MPLNTYISNDIENLAGKLAETIRSKPLELYQKESIVVQTEGMNRWLSVKISEKNKIFSNFEFFSPNNILFELFKLANLRSADIFNTGNLRWLIYKILGSSDFQKKFTRTFQYFEGDKIKQLQLATKLADLYDQYSIYRPDYIRLWNNDKVAEVKQAFVYHEKWQRWIWNKIKEEVKDYNFDKVETRDRLVDKLTNDPDFIEKIKKKYPRISLFGFSIFTPFHLEIFLGALKDHIDVDFYLFNPAPEDFWLQDIPEKTKIKIEDFYGKSSQELNLTVGNNLLMNLGKTAKELYLMLFENETFINNLDNETLTQPPDRDTLLKRIQFEIYHNINESQREKIPESLIFDGSVSIISNYSMVREVEALYNYLLKQIQENGYKPVDIIVQTTNIDAYTPYIKAVFDNSPVKLPYKIADRSYAGTDNLVGILKQILTLQKDEFTSENVLQILEFEEVKNKFDIINISKIRELVDKANIRHGIEGDINNDTIFVSWRYGLERILLGYAMHYDSLYQIPGKEYPTIPLDITEGEYAVEGLKLKAFIDKLILFLDNRSQKRTLEEWRIFITDFIDEIMLIPDDKSDQLNYILDKMSFPDIIDELLDEKFSYEVFSRALIDSLYMNNRLGKFISGNITFCSMIPMRSIPYKIVVILGLNQGVFPRKNKDISFDLIMSDQRYADRNIKDSDKYLFLESLISAREKLYLSYIGQSIKDNTEIPPSPVIDEVLDYIESGSGIEDLKDKLIIKHPLHSFDNKYYDDNFPDFYTYLDYGQNADFADISVVKPEEESENDEISIKKLMKFFKDPVKWYFNEKLKIYYNAQDVLLPETEVFEVDNLTKHNLKSNILKIKEENVLEEYIITEIIKGDLPLKNNSRVEIEKIKDDLSDLIEKYRMETNGYQERSFYVEIKLRTGITIQGEINNVWDDKIIIPNLTTSKTKETKEKNFAKNLTVLQLYRWICSIADLPVNNFMILSNDPKQDLILEKIDKEEAEKKLIRAIDYFKQGKQEILPFYPMASFSYTNKRYKPGRSKKMPIDAFMDSLDTTAKEESDKVSYIDPYLKKLNRENYLANFKEKEDEIRETGDLFFKEIIDLL